ncbi:MAG TPA: hypothetical protein VMW09_10250 [Desulfatiglandales bacterium]|nr:hypothetical protein [Desulfatiglandales bacterium]
MMGKLKIPKIFRKIKDKYKVYLGQYRIYKRLKAKYPHYEWFLELEKEMGNFTKARNCLFDWKNRGFVDLRDSKGVGFDDDYQYTLTPRGIDKLSVWRKVKNIILYIAISVLILVIASYLMRK